MVLEGLMLSEIKSDRERQILHNITSMWNLKYTTNENNKKWSRLADIENKLVINSRWGGRPNKRWRTGRYKLFGVRLQGCIYCTIWSIEPVFYNNYKWSITFKKIFENQFLKKEEIRTQSHVHKNNEMWRWRQGSGTTKDCQQTTRS